MAVVVIAQQDIDSVNRTTATHSELRGLNNTKSKNRYAPMEAESAGASVETIVYRRTVYYRKRGYNVGLSAFEYWRTTDPTSTNPSGNPLIDVMIIGSVYEA